MTSASPKSPFDGEQQITRSGLGRIATIGQMYDIRTESFFEENIFRQGSPQKFASTSEKMNKSITLQHSEQFSDKLASLNIEWELHLPIATGVITPTGNSRYLIEATPSSKEVAGSVHYKLTTKTSKLIMPFAEMAKRVDQNLLNDQNCTHFVVGIEYGAASTIQLWSKPNEKREDKELVDLLSQKLKQIENALGSESGNGFEIGDFGWSLFGDLQSATADPKSVKEAIQIVQNYPQEIAKMKPINGVPLVYTLCSIAVLKKCKIDIDLSRSINPVPELTVMSIISYYEEALKMRTKLVDIGKEIETNHRYLLENTQEAYLTIKDTFERNVEIFKSSLASEMTKTQIGLINIKVFLKNTEKCKTDISLSTTEDGIKSLLPVLEQIRLIQNLQEKGIEYLGRGDTVNFEAGKPCVALMSIRRSGQQELYDKSLETFLQLWERRDPTRRFLLADLDLGVQSNLSPDYNDKIRIVDWDGTKFISYDVLNDEILAANANFARCSKMSPVAHPPVQRVTLQTRCVNRKTCSSDALTWTCPKCKDIIIYGFDDHFYCVCGRGKADQYEFRCANETHGQQYTRLGRTKEFKNNLSKLNPTKDLNILILGQSGVGKSTWINSIVNYLQYETLQEARQGGVLNVVPSSFNVQYDDQTQRVEIGEEDPNENLGVGQSATKGPRTYSTILGDHLVRLIDTPGLGDTSGIEKDKENMRAILDHISHIKEIHGICILLKSNESRIDVLFNFCMKELLVHLHRNAAKNIIFCFTNARSSNYTPGDTQAVLEKLLADMNLSQTFQLNQKNKFCLDNEAFRFLCTLKYPNIHYKEEELHSYDFSWKISVKETKRLVDQIQKLEPHVVVDTTTLCNTRARIINLTKPIAEITQTLQLNLAAIAHEEKKIQMSTNNRQDLAKDLHIPEIFLEPENLPRPRTVCTSPSCVEVYKLTQSNTSQIEYTTHCHPECYLQNVVPQVLPNTDLLHCWAMQGTDTCITCGCSWEKHMHITYNQKRTEKQVINKNVETEILSIDEAEKKIRQHIKKLEDRSQTLRKEETKILETASKFAQFLKVNAIAPYNDGFKQYLEYLISQEENKITRTKVDDEMLKGLKDWYKRYLAEVAILGKIAAVKQGDINRQLTPADIQKLEKELYDLEIMGADIRKNAKMSKKANTKAKHYTELSLPIKNKKSPAFYS